MRKRGIRRCNAGLLRSRYRACPLLGWVTSHRWVRGSDPPIAPIQSVPPNNFDIKANQTFELVYLQIRFAWLLLAYYDPHAEWLQRSENIYFATANHREIALHTATP